MGVVQPSSLDLDTSCFTLRAARLRRLFFWPPSRGQ